MKQIIANYNFNATAKTVTLSDFSTVRLDRLQLIVDATTNTILYNFADSTVASATVSGNIITLSTTGSASNSDKLQIIYDTLSGDPTYDVQPVSASSLPLPTGAAQDSTLTSGSQKTVVRGGAKGTTTAADVTSFSVDANTQALHTSVTNFPATQQISASSLPLPTGAAQEHTAAATPASVRVSNGSSFVDPSQIRALTSADQVTVANSSLNVSATVATDSVGLAKDSTLTGGSLQTKITNGTTVADTFAGDTGNNGQIIGRGIKTFTFSTTTVQASSWYDLSNYAQVCVQVTTQGTSSTVGFQGSNNASNADAVALLSVGAVGTSNPTQSVTTTGTWGASIGYRYFRLNVTGISAGTTNVTIIASTTSYSPLTSAVNASLVTSSNTIGVIATGANIIGKVGIDQTTVGTTNAVSLAQLGTGTINTGNGTSGTGTLRVAIASDQTSNTNALYVKQQVQTTGGATAYKLISAATTNATNIKASAGTIYGIQAYNTSTTTIAYLKIYNKASAPTVGTDVPVKVIALPFSATGGGSNVPITPVGIALGTGISFAITGGIADSDTTAVTVSQVVVNIDYA
jgi:hypothetical protein